MENRRGMRLQVLHLIYSITVPSQHQPIPCAFQPRLQAVLKAEYSKFFLVEEKISKDNPRIVTLEKV